MCKRWRPASEELSASVREISSQVVRSTQITGEAVRAAEQANKQVLGTTATAERIGSVVQLIQNIAGQTNLPGAERDNRGGSGRRRRQRASRSWRRR